MKASILALTLPLLLAQELNAQHEHSPYVGLEIAEGTTLTPQELQQLRNGDGMRQALPAELNQYPGPKHVLELADQLGLTEEQRHRISGLFDTMRAEAILQGEKIIVAERGLTQAFRVGAATPDQVVTMTQRLASMRGRLQATHLVAHLATKELLTEAQVSVYDQLRGY